MKQFEKCGKIGSKEKLKNEQLTIFDKNYCKLKPNLSSLERQFKHSKELENFFMGGNP